MMGRWGVPPSLKLRPSVTKVDLWLMKTEAEGGGVRERFMTTYIFQSVCTLDR
jgi:hypothetical protein